MKMVHIQLTRLTEWKTNLDLNVMNSELYEENVKVIWHRIERVRFLCVIIMSNTGKHSSFTCDENIHKGED